MLNNNKFGVYLLFFVGDPETLRLFWVYFVNKVAKKDGPTDSFKTGRLITIKINHVIRRLKLIPPGLRRGEKEWRLSSVTLPIIQSILPTWWTSIKFLDTWSPKSILVGEYSHVLGSETPGFVGSWNRNAAFLSEPHIIPLFSWLGLLIVPFIINHNCKLHFSEFYESFL